MAHQIKLPPAFVTDCIECDCDVGEYVKPWLTANKEQLAELRSRADHYANGGVDDPSCFGLVRSAKATLAALDREGL